MFYLCITAIWICMLSSGERIVGHLSSQRKKFISLYPVHNFKTFFCYMNSKKLPKNDLVLRNKNIFFQITRRCLAYCAASMKSKKKAVYFLWPYNKLLRLTISPSHKTSLWTNGLEILIWYPMFSEDKTIRFAKTAFEADRK